jgi:hypothetical protein
VTGGSPRIRAWPPARGAARNSSELGGRDLFSPALPIGPDVTTLAVHIVNNTALTGATYDMDGKSGSNTPH